MERCPPPGHRPPGLLSRFPQQPLLVLPATRFMRLSQGFAILVERQEAAQSRPSPGPHHGPFISWVGLRPNSTELPPLARIHWSRAGQGVEWAGGVASKDGAPGWQRQGEGLWLLPQWHPGVCPPLLFMYRQDGLPAPPGGRPPHTLPELPTRGRVHLGEDREVDDAGREVEGRLLAVVDHGDAVAVPVAGPGHAALEDGEGQPAGQKRRAVGGALDTRADSHWPSWQRGSRRLASVQGREGGSAQGEGSTGQTPISS